MTQTQQAQSLRVSPKEAWDLFEAGNVTVLDVVDTEDYPRITFEIPDAVRIPPERIHREFEQLPRDRTILTYCT